MKKLLTILLATSLLVVACGKDKEAKDAKNEAAKPVEVSAVTTDKCLNFLNQVLFGNL